MESTANYERTRSDNKTEEPRVKRAKLELDGNSLKDYDHRVDRNVNDNQKDISRTRKKEESHFLRLYTSILNAIVTIKGLHGIHINQSIVSIRESFKFDSGPFSFSAIDFTKWENICGYLYRYASHGAGFARFRILNAIRNCRVVEEILKKTNSKIICLGTGPGNDAVGLCSALSELHYPKSLKMTLVDKFNEWSLCIKLAKVLIEEDNLGNVSKLFHNTDVELLFIQTDLPGNFTSDKQYFEILAEADVIVISKLVSILDKSNGKESERIIVKTDLPGNFTSDKQYFEILAEADVIVISKLVSILDKSNGKESERIIVKSLYEHAKDDAVVLLNDSLDKEIWSNFHLVYSWGEKKDDEYVSSALAERRFNHCDAVTSKLPINVLIKKEPPENFSVLSELFDCSEFL